MITTNNISKQFGSSPLFEGINITFSKGNQCPKYTQKCPAVMVATLILDVESIFGGFITIEARSNG